MDESNEMINCCNERISPMLHYFSVIYRQGKVIHDRGLKKFDLTGHQMRYLRHIDEKPGISQEELAKHLKIDKGAVAKAIKDMADKGYVKKEKNPNDGRAYNLFVTDKAARICVMGRRYLFEFEKSMTRGMTDEELKTFETLLEKVTGNISKMLEGETI